MFTIKEKIIDLGDGRTITLETGRMARQADGSVFVKNGKDNVAGYCSVGARRQKKILTLCLFR